MDPPFTQQIIYNLSHQIYKIIQQIAVGLFIQ
jgi:hypothetical protein